MPDQSHAKQRQEVMSSGGQFEGGTPPHVQPKPHQRGVAPDVGIVQGGHQLPPSTLLRHHCYDDSGSGRPVYVGTPAWQKHAHGGSHISDQQQGPPGGLDCLSGSIPVTTPFGRNIVDAGGSPSGVSGSSNKG